MVNALYWKLIFRFDEAMRCATVFITGTDTGVGKTVLTALLAGFLRGRGVPAAAIKPVCSGGRADARALRTALHGALTLDEIAPWHFCAPVAPVLAARREHTRVTFLDVLAHVRAMQRRFDVLLVEGAGGVLSPLGERFDSRDLIAALRATPVVVCPNRLGAVNQVRLALQAMPRGARTKARVVLMSPEKADAATGTNALLLAEFVDPRRLFALPWFGRPFNVEIALKRPGVRRTLGALLQT